MTIDELRNDPQYMFHHTSMRRGYVSRRSRGTVVPYKGRFGEGYMILTPRRDTTRYMDAHYYIRQPDNA